jgi:hypothetical protein
MADERYTDFLQSGKIQDAAASSSSWAAGAEIEVTLCALRDQATADERGGELGHQAAI